MFINLHDTYISYQFPNLHGMLRQMTDDLEPAYMNKESTSALPHVFSESVFSYVKFSVPSHRDYTYTDVVLLACLLD